MENFKEIFNIQSEDDFEQCALDLFRLHYTDNNVYRSFCDLLNIDPSSIHHIEDIPFLPISFFKSHKVALNQDAPDTIFESSGTTGQQTSKHYVSSLSLYEESFTKAFNLFFGEPIDWIILALLPSYLERENSSLIYMVNNLVEATKNEHSGFYLNNHEELYQKLTFLEKTSSKKILLIGVSFGLLDFIYNYRLKLNKTIVMETGGMKGRRKELIKTELHNTLKDGFGVSAIYSEYGMTELLSQAYSTGENIFKSPPWMKILIRDTEDPLTLLANGISGGINVIDLANYNSCPFIATQDLGKRFDDKTFEIIGRFDHADIRGCNLLVF